MIVNLRLTSILIIQNKFKANLVCILLLTGLLFLLTLLEQVCRLKPKSKKKFPSQFRN